MTNDFSFRRVREIEREKQAREAVEPPPPQAPAYQAPAPVTRQPPPESAAPHEAPAHEAPARGYTRVPNGLLDALLPTLEPYEQLVLLRLYRLTAGFHREAVTVSFLALGRACNVSEKTAMRVVKTLRERGLVEQRVVISGKVTERGNEYRLTLAPAFALQAGDSQTPAYRAPARQAPARESGMKERTKDRIETAPVAAAPALSVYDIRRIVARFAEAHRGDPDYNRARLRADVVTALVGEGREVDDGLVDEAIGA